MSCLDNTDILRIVGGNSFQIAITVKARRVSDGSEIEDFDLSASSPVLNLIHAGEKTRKYFVTQGNQAIISFDGSEGLGYYGMEMSGSYDSEAWRFCIEKVLQIVDTNAKANIPEWSVLVDDTYFVEGTISIYGGGGGGDTVQADWAETNPTSAAFILHKPDLSVYATKTEVASGLAGKQDTIVDLTSIRYGAAAGATAYQKPSSGIPATDMSEDVQSALDKAEDAYQKPASGIPATDMSESVQASLEKANSAVQTETDPVFSNSPAAEISQNDINSWNAKQSAIADLAAIREGAAAGATAVQPDEMAQAIDEVDGDIADINAKIPATASNLNQLADKAYVNSSIATNSATYRGSFNLITDLGMNVDATHAQIAGALATAIVTADNNDYAFVQIPDSASTPTVIAKIERYKHNGTGWVYEYDLNNSGFTAAQWAAINSGITSGLVGKLADLPNNSELATLLNGKQNVINDLSAIRSGAAAGATAVQPADLTEALNGVDAEIAGLDESKQDTIEDLSTIRSGAAAGATAYQKPGTGIPESDMSDGVQTSLGKADSAYQKPANGIPASDMDSEVQAALEKANSAVQTESDPVFSGSPAAEITQTDINTWNAKQPAISDLADIREGAAAGATAVQPDEMAQAIDEVDGDIADINAKIPTAASNLNQLADKAYVNSSISTNSATYRGSFNLITDLGMNVDATHAQIAGALATAIVTADNNDYAFVQIPDSASTPTVIAKIERYKHNGSGWVYEYDLNNSGFTAAQWAAINSGITSGLVGKLSDLPNNSELATLLNGKQNTINDLSAIRSGASAGSTAYQKPSSGIPASDMSSTVQQELSKANTAVQTETDPIFSASPAAGITAQNIQTWNGEPAARQAADTALQNSVSTLQTDLAAETTARQSADTALQTAIQDEASARATADALLQQQYNALTQSDIIVGALPASGVADVIYRVPGTTDFSDYMWYGGQFVLMATYGLPISAEFVVDDNLNKTQEEVNAEVSPVVQAMPDVLINGTAAIAVNGFIKTDGGSSSYRIDGDSAISVAIPVYKGAKISVSVPGMNSVFVAIAYKATKTVTNNDPAGTYTPLALYNPTGEYHAYAPNDGYVFIGFHYGSGSTSVAYTISGKKPLYNQYNTYNLALSGKQFTYKSEAIQAITEPYRQLGLHVIYRDSSGGVQEIVFTGSSLSDFATEDLWRNVLDECNRIELLNDVCSSSGVGNDTSISCYRYGYVNSSTAYNPIVYTPTSPEYKVVIIPVNAGETYTYYNSSSVGGKFCVFLDSTKGQRVGNALAASAGINTYTVPSGAYYLALTIQFGVSDTDYVNSYIRNNAGYIQTLQDVKSTNKKLESILIDSGVGKETSLSDYEFGYVTSSGQSDAIAYTPTSPEYKVVIIPVNAGETYVYNYTGTKRDLRLNAFLNEDKTQKIGGNINKLSVGQNILTVPSGAYYLALTIQFGVSDTYEGAWLKISTSDFIVLREDIKKIGKSILPIRYKKDGVQLYVATIWDDDNYLVQTAKIHRAPSDTNNPNFNLEWVRKVPVNQSITSTGTVLKNMTDDICPVMLNGSYIGGNHGWSYPQRVTANSHGKTLADVGAKYQDEDGVSFYILRIVDENNLIMISENIDASYNYTFKTPSGTLSYVDNGFSTSNIIVSSSTGIGNLYGSLKESVYTLFADNTEVTNDGEYYAKELSLIETYDILDLPSIISSLYANRPVNGYTEQPLFCNLPNVDTLATRTVSYKFLGNGTVLVGTSLLAHKKLRLGFDGVVQAIEAGGDSPKVYVPKVNPVTVDDIVYDFTKLVSWTSFPGTTFPVGTWSDADNAPDRVVNKTDSILCMYGYITDRGIETQRSSILSGTHGALYLAASLKLYPIAIDTRTLDVMDNYSVVAYRCFTNPSKNPTGRTNYASVKIDDSATFVYVDYHGALLDRLPIQDEWLGKKITVVEKTDNIALITDVVSGFIIINSTATANNYGYIVLKLS